MNGKKTKMYLDYEGLLGEKLNDEKYITIEDEILNKEIIKSISFYLQNIINSIPKIDVQYNKKYNRFDYDIKIENYYPLDYLCDGCRFINSLTGICNHEKGPKMESRIGQIKCMLFKPSKDSHCTCGSDQICRECYDKQKKGKKEN